MNSLKYNIALMVCVLLIKTNSIWADNDLRIVGGRKAKIEDHPWIVSLLYTNKQHACGGSLINDDTVVTAAHCFMFQKLFELKYVLVGVSNWRHAKTFIEIKKYKEHENFHPQRDFDNDIAIVKLAHKVVFSSKIQPIRLPKHDIYVPNGTPVTTAGWGYTDPKIPKLSDELLEININIIDWQTCKERISHVSKFTERMICAGNLNGGQDACQGDSGGPLELNGTLIGVVSWGDSCGKPGTGGAYTKVSDFVTWINKNINI
ncbi:trypsin-7-like [Diabrotica undecimpunctata]|uniref:trypsin-7-like n=1 Tax=Diabrotica undecimpunctata TaxID=50387 RepID=UPI003B63D6D3